LAAVTVCRFTRKLQQKAIIKSLSAEGTDAQSSADPLEVQFGPPADSIRTVGYWQQERRFGRADLYNLPRTGRPPSEELMLQFCKAHQRVISLHLLPRPGAGCVQIDHISPSNATTWVEDPSSGVCAVQTFAKSEGADVQNRAQASRVAAAEHGGQFHIAYNG
jgi:hypothetical protein